HPPQAARRHAPRVRPPPQAPVRRQDDALVRDGDARAHVQAAEGRGHRGGGVDEVEAGEEAARLREPPPPPRRARPRGAGPPGGPRQGLSPGYGEGAATVAARSFPRSSRTSAAPPSYNSGCRTAPLPHHPPSPTREVNCGAVRAEGSEAARGR